MVKNLPAKAEDAKDMGSIPGLERSPGGGNGNPLQYFCLEKPMDRGAWQATVRGVAKSQTRLSNTAQVTEKDSCRTTVQKEACGFNSGLFISTSIF